MSVEPSSYQKPESMSESLLPSNKVRVTPGMNPVVVAAVYIESAATGGHEPPIIVRDNFSYGVYRFRHKLFWLRAVSLLALLLLSFFEVPSWCWAAGSDCTAPYPGSSVAEGETAVVLNSNITKLPQFIGLIAEAALLGLLLIIDPILQFVVIGRTQGMARGTPPIRLVLYLFAIADVVVSFFYPTRSFRISPYLRPLIFIASSYELFAIIKSIGKALVSMFQILVLLALLIAAYSWIGVIIWGSTTAGEEYFSDYATAIKAMQILLTTANSPDMLVPEMVASRWSAIYFVLFFVLGLYLLLPLVLASVYDGFKEEHEAERTHRDNMIRLRLEEAFEILDVNNSGELEFDTLFRLFKEFNRLSRSRKIDLAKALNYMNTLDVNASKTITKDEFVNVLKVIRLTFNFVKEPWLHRKFPGFFTSRGFKGFVSGITSRYYEYVINLIVIASIAECIWETARFINSETATEGFVDLGLSVFFLLELVLKLIALGWTAYFASYTNQFNALIALTSVAAFVLYVPYFNISAGIIIRILLIIRITRLFRIIASMRSCQLIVSTFSTLLPKLARVAMALTVLYYFFALLGIEFFGGRVFEGAEELQDTTFDDLDFYVDNFNDFGQAVLTLFQLMVVGNWFPLADGFEAVTSAWFRFYFVSWWVLCVIVILNIQIALIIDAFIEAHQRDRASRSSPVQQAVVQK